ncbi:ion transporter [Marinomonas mediterranea]|jgi:Ion transport protein.|uniref:Ion transport protein n=1 Tax=Marinomonas mediterranea (strain ATCC 700492 / JCM 21426 / NBRC 103028 / MMB-1) TaxID=717774 RepID=F2JYL6_MARM1|nr:ion transporter [Marinomonas mediterranea]ADZ93145.1 Ion transport protein [Marinomonas mediterranea MMB-1]WCN15110.1 ion transporter [Marinomonas mediterranea]WCN19153.1 ion transporter [Marinomonas mediterranea MMB-1]
MEVTPSNSFLGLVKRVERSVWFQGFIISIIIIAALTVGAKTYSLPYEVELAINYLDTAITVFFLVEIVLRFISYEKKRAFFKDPWNVFDMVIVVGSLMPISDTDMILVARLLRVFRVLRLVSIIPDLRVLINALLKAIPKMGYIALLMFIIFYLFAAVGSIFFENVNETLWGDIAISMLTLFRVATFEDWTDVMYETMAVYPFSWIFYVVFIFLTAFVFLNMMVGVVLDVMTQETSAKEHQEQEDNHQALVNQISELQKQVQALSEKLDKPKD